MKRQKGRKHFFTKGIAITVVCLFTFTTVACSAPTHEASAVHDVLQYVVNAQTLAAQQGAEGSKQNLKQRVREFINKGDILEIFRNNSPELLAAKEATASTPKILPKRLSNSLFKSILSSIFIAFFFFATFVKGQAQRIDFLDVTKVDASVYSKLPGDLNRPIRDLIRAITRDVYKSQVQNGYYSIGETSSQKEADAKAAPLRRYIPSVDIKIKKVSSKKYVLFMKYLNNRDNILWQVDYLSQHLDFSKENIIANIWKESAFDETAFSSAGAGGYLQVMTIAFKEIRDRYLAIEKNKETIAAYASVIESDTKKLKNVSAREKKLLQAKIKINEINREHLVKERDILYRYLYAVTPKHVRDQLKSYQQAPHGILTDNYFSQVIDVPPSLRSDINVQGKLSRYSLWGMHIGDLNIPAGVTVKALYMNDIEKMKKQGEIPADTEPELAADLMYNMGPGNFAKLMINKTSFADMIGSGLSQESRNYACKFLIMKLKIEPTYKIIKGNNDLDQKVKRYLITQVIFCDNSDVRLNFLKKRMRPLEKDAKNYADMDAKKKKLQPSQQRTLDKYNQLKGEHDMIEKSLRYAKKMKIDRTIRFNDVGEWLSQSSGKRRNISWRNYSNDNVKHLLVEFLDKDAFARTYHGYLIKALYGLEWNDQLAKGNYRNLPTDGKIRVKKEGNLLWLLILTRSTVVMLSGYSLNRKRVRKGQDSNSEETVPTIRPGKSGKDRPLELPVLKESTIAVNENDYLGILFTRNEGIRPESLIERDLTFPKSQPRDRHHRSDGYDISLDRAHLAAA